MTNLRSTRESFLAELYHDNKNYGRQWRRFPGFNPTMPWLSLGNKAIEPLAFLDQIKYTFFSPDTPEDIVNKQFREAINRGRDGLNALLRFYLPEIAEPLECPSLEESFGLPDYIREAKQKNELGKASRDRTQQRQAFGMVQSIELGYRVLTIDVSRDVHHTLHYYTEVLSWFKRTLEIEDATESHLDTSFPFAWPASNGTNLLGTREAPFRSRLKYLTKDGDVKYASILLKQINSLKQTSDIHDYAGVELLVADDDERDRLLYHFRYSRLNPNLERFKDLREGKANKNTGVDFNCVKFIVRVPVPTPDTIYHPLGQYSHVQVPVEVQILTLDEYQAREANPDASHEAYRRKQLTEAFPVIFPKKLYSGMLRRFLSATE